MARGSTVYLRPPAPHSPRKAKAKTAREELSAAAFRYRVQLLPFLIAGWWGALATIFGPIRIVGTMIHGGVPLACAAIGIALAEYADRVPDRYRLERQVERWYVGACAAVAGLWMLWATWGAVKPSPRTIAALVVGTGLCAAPWWHHRRVRGSIPVRFQDGVSARDRQEHLREARGLIRDWVGFTSAAHMQGAKIRHILYTPWSVVLGVELRRGATVSEFTTRRLEKLESAFGTVRAGSARVERVDRFARLVTVRFMIKDPHESPIRPPEDDGSISLDDIIIGLFETGEKVLFKLVNTVIGGTTGSGKSGVVNMVIRALARIPTVAILGIDMKPGAPELGKWRKVMHALATDAVEARELLEQLLAGLTYRGTVMAENRWRKWRVSKSNPFIVLIIDETQEIKAAGLSSMLERITAMIRAYGGCVIVATQYPTKNNLSPTIKGNCSQRIGLRTQDGVADRVIFGEKAVKDMWRPSTISSDRPGSFLIESPEYKTPLLSRAFWMEEEEIDAEAERWAPIRTPVDDGTWGALTSASATPIETPAGAAPVGSFGGVAVLTKPDAPEIVDAIVVDDDPAEQILAAIGRGRSRIKDIVADTGISRAQVYRHLSALKDQGLVEQVRYGVYARSREPGS
jgi:DNA segregation ATPase FtsK/SpoIIIE, S-DNA-T family